MAKKSKQQIEFVCPECGSDRVTVEARTKYMANGLDHWCHTVKVQDSNALADCLECEWSGINSDLKRAAQAKEGGAQ